jgi:hypothetical protein
MFDGLGASTRDALAKTLSPYLSGTLIQVIDNPVQALSPAGRPQQSVRVANAIVDCAASCAQPASRHSQEQTSP